LSQEFDVVCLGGGVAGEAIAVGLQDSGLTLAVVERELVGGECPYWGCIPSKTLLRSGETLSEAGRARVLAASRVEWAVDFPKVLKRALWMARDLDDSRPAAAMEATGARLFRGEGKLTDLHTVAVGSEQLIARQAVVIANGSTAAIPAIPGLDTVPFWTNRQAVIPKELPASLAILGGGAIGVELGQAFARLGSKVTVIEAGSRFLGLEEPEAGAALRPHLEADGITLMIGDPCVAVEEQSADPSRQRSAVVVHLKSGTVVSADRLLVATGRRPNVEAWRSIGIAQTERGWLKVDPATLEARTGVFGAGDVTGLGGFTHLAYYHGQVVARRLRGMDARADHRRSPTSSTHSQPSTACSGRAWPSSPRRSPERQTIGGHDEQGRNEARGRHYPRVRRRSRQTFLRGPGVAARRRFCQGRLASRPAHRDQASGVARRVGERRVTRDHRQRQDVEFRRAPGEQQRQGIVDAGIDIEDRRGQRIHDGHASIPTPDPTMAATPRYFSMTKRSSITSASSSAARAFSRTRSGIGPRPNSW
jgi:pyruvate/2-oxoglutarate dehydrogenase complex dihydrolipoamide dehydrogenase (E3) component